MSRASGFASFGPTEIRREASDGSGRQVPWRSSGGVERSAKRGVDSEGLVLTRFASANTRHWFTLQGPRGVKWDSVTSEQWDDILSHRLCLWPVDEINDDRDE
jgi:hypothetical protein